MGSNVELKSYDDKENDKTVLSFIESYISNLRKQINDFNEMKGTMDLKCDHHLEKLYNKNGDYKADFCLKCKGVY